MIYKLFVPLTGEYVEMSLEECISKKQQVMEKGFVCWLVSINSESIN